MNQFRLNRSLLLLMLAALLATSASTLTGCATAAIAGAGAVGGIAYTDRGAKGDVKGDVPTVNSQARTALQEMNIEITGTEMKEAGREQNLAGKSGNTDVTVQLTQATADTTHVEVVAKESTFKWNKDYAKQILARITRR